MAEHHNTPAKKQAGKDTKIYLDDGHKLGRGDGDFQIGQQAQTPRQDASKESLKKAKNELNG